jgi:pimeloyl-ACP methyl ester carboxylesterase
MFEKLKAKILFHKFLKRPDIQQAYKMVGPEDSWYDTISTVHRSLHEIQKLPREIWHVESHDGLRMEAIFYPGTSDKTMVWIHGYTSHAERESAFPALFYHSLGFNVLIPYLRAHGPSEGKYISFGPKEALDIRDWVHKINQRLPNGEIVIHGLSMGGGIALDLATQEMENVKGMIVDAPSHSIGGFWAGVTQYAFKKDYEKILPHVYHRYEMEFSADARDFDRVENIKRGLYPLLLSAGSNEQLEDVLSKIQQNNPKKTEMIILPGCNHGNGMYKQTEMYQNAIRAFLDENMTR